MAEHSTPHGTTGCHIICLEFLPEPVLPGKWLKNKYLAKLDRICSLKTMRGSIYPTVMSSLLRGYSLSFTVHTEER